MYKVNVNILYLTYKDTLIDVIMGMSIKGTLLEVIVIRVTA